VDNDRLTLAFAHPRDLWFHVLGLPGSHVIMEGQLDKEPDRETLRRAAAIAAYHSKARNGGLVTVLCTEVRFVKKPPRAKPGSVQVRKETRMKVRPALPPEQP
jgi:predicted ribosome quality control (RQC) complex YloA/Tae2 family protein